MTTTKKGAIFIEVEDAQKSIIFQSNDFERTINNSELTKLFNEGSGNSGSFPIFEGKNYAFDLNFSNNYEGVLFFGMLGDVANVENVRYLSQVTDLLGENGTLVEKVVDTFAQTELNSSTVCQNVNVRISGTFKCTANGFLQPAISFDSIGFGCVTKKGSFIEVKEIETTSDIV